MAVANATDVVRFWVEETDHKNWYVQDDALDARIRKQFLFVWEAAFAGGLTDWLEAPDTILGYLILTDQFPRNMFRGEARAFETDGLAREAANIAIYRRWDLQVPEPQRQFCYLPLMHSENIGDQDVCIRLMSERMPETGASNLLHARAHREIIRRFGRFPFRNAAHGRMTLPSERAFLEGEGYGGVLRQIEAAAGTAA